MSDTFTLNETDKKIAESDAQKPEAKEDPGVATDTKADFEPSAVNSCDQGNDVWICNRGSFRLNGRYGRGIYEYNGQHYDTTWTFNDCSNVGSKRGWTYKENGYEFYMFFSRSGSNGKFELLYSHNNRNFTHYCWAR